MGFVCEMYFQKHLRLDKAAHLMPRSSELTYLGFPSPRLQALSLGFQLSLWELASVRLVVSSRLSKSHPNSP